MESKIKEIVKTLLNEKVDYAKYGNGKEAPYRRIIKDDKEYTLIGNTTDFTGAFLYIGEIGSTVSRLKKGRLEFGEKVQWASLYANNIKSENEFCVTL